MSKKTRTKAKHVNSSAVAGALRASNWSVSTAALPQINSHASHWTIENARGIRATTTNTFPAFDTGVIKQLMPGYESWDNWPVRDEDGYIANIGGFIVMLALVRPEGADFGSDERIAYFYSEDGKHYKNGGFLIGETKLYGDVREWSGSTILREDGMLQTFYTCSYGKEYGGVWQTVQRLATAIQEVVVAPAPDENSYGYDIIIKTPHYHELMGGVCEPDGNLYETPQQASERESNWPTRHRVSVGSDQTENNCNRDPFYFRDPVTRKRYLAFEGNTGAAYHPPGYVRPEYVSAKGLAAEGFAPTEDMLKANGCIGLIELVDDENTYGQFLPPLVTANLVTDEIERINIIFHQGHYYLFCVGHGNKNTLVSENADLTNRDYMLGFRAASMQGPWTPLNGTGVVVQQKSYGEAYGGQAENEQAVYSWLLVPDRNQKPGIFRCMSYANYCNSGGEVKPLMNAGPSIKIEIDGLSTRIVGLMYDVQPFGSESVGVEELAR